MRGVRNYSNEFSFVRNKQNYEKNKIGLVLVHLKSDLNNLSEDIELIIGKLGYKPWLLKYKT